MNTLVSVNLPNRVNEGERFLPQSPLTRRKINSRLVDQSLPAIRADVRTHNDVLEQEGILRYGRHYSTGGGQRE